MSQERVYEDLECPECGGVLVEVRDCQAPEGRCWYCQTSIGELAYDSLRAHAYIPQPSPHTRVIGWTLDDGYIRGQLDLQRSEIEVRPVRRRKAA